MSKKRRKKKNRPCKTIEAFIESSCRRMENDAGMKIDSIYNRTHSPLKRGEMKRYRESPERDAELKRILSQNEFYEALTGPDPVHDDRVISAFQEKLDTDRQRRMRSEARLAIDELLGGIDLYQFIEEHFSVEELEQPIIDYFQNTEFYIEDILMSLIDEHMYYYPKDFFDHLFDDYFQEKQTLYYGERLNSAAIDWYSYRDSSEIRNYLFNSECVPYTTEAVIDALAQQPAFEDIAAKFDMFDLREFMQNEISERVLDFYYDEISGDFETCDDIIPLILAGSYPESALAASRVYERRTLEKAENIRQQAEQEKRQKHALEQKILTRMPDRYIDFFPAARSIKRHFILHIGPTNSGKTHDALNRYLSAESGIYLAPLRLLAHEIYEYASVRGIPCNMVTGEEEILTPGARHVSSTVEMLEQRVHYDVAVIDEAQMIIDRDRGYAWTNAICGVYAEEVHVCMAAEALKLVQSLIKECCDSFEVVRHERMTPLVYDPSFREFPKSVREHDALIVFSRRDVHACANDLRRTGIRASLIYGALPYPVRKREVEKFLQGETDVVVATDAIGMGMNLPIQRIVFLETSKFDGRETRPLYPEEFRQIAGRAGRRGMYEEGFYASSYDDVQLEGLHTPVDHAPISFPETLLGLDEPMGDLVRRWNDLPRQGVFKVSKIDLSLCDQLCQQTTNKRLIYDFLSLPVEEKTEVLRELWFQLFLLELTWEQGSDQVLAQMCRVPYDSLVQSDLELAHKKCDLLYSYCRKFNHPDMKDQLVETRRQISQKIMKLLESQKYAQRRCSRCGRILPWNYPYGICQSCFDLKRSGGGRRRRRRH